MNTGKRTITAISLLALSAGLLTAGAAREELPVIFTKAVNICLECIGLG